MSEQRSRYTHAVCNVCFAINFPGRNPARLIEQYRNEERCCYCNEPTKSGIYVRVEPSSIEGHREHA